MVKLSMKHSNSFFRISVKVTIRRITTTGTKSPIMQTLDRSTENSTQTIYQIKERKFDPNPDTKPGYRGSKKNTRIPNGDKSRLKQLKKENNVIQSRWVLLG